ncbi:hypothetical protein TB2_032484 [Malus domestica]
MKAKIHEKALLGRGFGSLAGRKSSGVSTEGRRIQRKKKRRELLGWGFERRVPETRVPVCIMFDSYAPPLGGLRLLAASCKHGIFKAPKWCSSLRRLVVDFLVLYCGKITIPFLDPINAFG